MMCARWVFAEGQEGMEIEVPFASPPFALAQEVSAQRGCLSSSAQRYVWVPRAAVAISACLSSVSKTRPRVTPCNLGVPCRRK